VATTPIVVLSRLNGDGSSASAATCSAGGGRERELADQVRHPGQTGRRVNDVAAEFTTTTAPT